MWVAAEATRFLGAIGESVHDETFTDQIEGLICWFGGGSISNSAGALGGWRNAVRFARDINTGGETDDQQSVAEVEIDESSRCARRLLP